MVKPNPAPSPRTLLHRAARVISGMAAEIRRSETVGGKWDLTDALVKLEHDDLRALATELRRLAKMLPLHDKASSRK